MMEKGAGNGLQKEKLFRMGGVPAWILRMAGICFFQGKDTFRVKEYIKSPLFFYCPFREVLYNYNHYARDMEGAWQ